MRLRIQFLVLALVSIWLVACGDDDSSGPSATPSDFSGIWQIQGEITSKRTCGGSIGQTDDFTLEIAQRGNSGYVLDETSHIPMTVNGSTARVQFEVGSREVVFQLEIEDRQLTGTRTETDTSVPCTEVMSLVGTLASAPPDPAFAGYWDLDVEITGSNCEGDVIGSSQVFCRRIQLQGNTAFVEDGEGDFIGVVDGDYVELRRSNDDEFVRIAIAVQENVLVGDVLTLDYIEPCEEQADVVGTRRQNPCGQQEPAPADFSGYWSFTSTEVLNDCGLPITDGCEWITQEGNVATLNNDALVGIVQGSRLVIHQEEPLSDTVTLVVDVDLELSGDGNSWTGTRSVEFVNSQNPQEDCETSTTVIGTRTQSCPPN